MAAGKQLERCEICQGLGVITGIFHVMECAGCNGGGVVTPSGQALDYPELVAALRDDLRAARRQIDHLKIGRQGAGGPEADYQGRHNKYHRGGGNWTGD